MKKLLVLLISIFQFVNSYSQEFINTNDSAVGSFHLSDNDWAIALTIDQLVLPLLDSLGNTMPGFVNSDGTYIITKINGHCSVQKFSGSSQGDTLVCKIGRWTNISESIICNYTIDSIQKAEKEWIFPNIYWNDSLHVYDVQANGNHSPSFRIIFRTKESTYYSNFDEVDIFTSQRLNWFFHKNLNYDHNANTFKFRAFMNFINLLKELYKINVLN